MNITLQSLITAIKVADSIPWPEIGKVIQQKFNDPEAVLVTVEDVASAIAPFVPAALTVEEVAAVLLILYKLHVITVGQPNLDPNSGIFVTLFGSDGQDHSHPVFV